MTLDAGSSEAERYREAREIASLPADDVLTQVRRFLADSSWRVRRVAWESLLQSHLDTREVQRFLVDGLDAEHTGFRTGVAEALLFLGSEAVPTMLEGLSQRSVRARKAILDLLARCRDTRAQSPALALLLNDEDENVRFAAAEVLGAVGDADAAVRMTAVLARASISDRFSILSALDRIARRTTFPLDMAEIAHYVEDPLCSIPAARLLGRIGPAESGPLLWDLLVSRQLDAAIEALAMFLHRIPGFRPAGADEQINGLIQRVSADAPPALRRHVFQIVSLLAPARLSELTGALLAADVDWLSDALAALPVPVVRSVLKALLDEEDGRWFAANLLGTREDLEGETTLLSLLSQPGLHHVETLRALGNVGTGRAVPHLLAACGDSDRALVEAASGALLRMAERRVEGLAAQLSSAMVHSTPEAMVAFLPALGRLDGTVGASAVVAAMRHADTAVRRAAVMASIPYAADEEVQRLLLSRLTDEDDEVRSAAAAACGDARLRAAAASLRILLDDDNPWCQATALRALSKLDALPDAEQMVSILARGGVVAAAAASVLGHHDYGHVFGRLQSMLYQLDDDAVAELVKALATFSEDLDEATVEWLLAHPAWSVRLAVAGYVAVKQRPWLLARVRDHLHRETDGLVRMALDELVH